MQAPRYAVRPERAPGRQDTTEGTPEMGSRDIHGWLGLRTAGFCILQKVVSLRVFTVLAVVYLLDHVVEQ